MKDESVVVVTVKHIPVVVVAVLVAIIDVDDCLLDRLSEKGQ